MSIRHVIRNISIFFFHLSGMTYLYRVLRKRNGPLVRVLVFHDIANQEWFESLIRTLNERYHLITPEDFVEKRFKTDAINILLTFDDGYESWVSRALPVLEKFDAKGIFFINSGLLDSAYNVTATQEFMKKQLLITPRVPLTWEGASYLGSRGHTIGSHGKHHLNLAQLSQTEIMNELEGDKRALEMKLGVKVVHCAYPFGTSYHVNDHVKASAKKSGFGQGYTTISSFATFIDPYAIARTCVEDSLTARTLDQWVEGGYDLFQIAKTVCVR